MLVIITKNTYINSVLLLTFWTFFNNFVLKLLFALIPVNKDLEYKFKSERERSFPEKSLQYLAVTLWKCQFRLIILTLRVSMLFLCISIVRETEMVSVESSTKSNLNPCHPNGIRGKMSYFFWSHTSFRCLKKMKTFWDTTKKCENKNSFFISINYFIMLWTGRANKVSCPSIFINI